MLPVSSPVPLRQAVSAVEHAVQHLDAYISGRSLQRVAPAELEQARRRLAAVDVHLARAAAASRAHVDRPPPPTPDPLVVAGIIRSSYVGIPYGYRRDPATPGR